MAGESVAVPPKLLPYALLLSTLLLACVGVDGPAYDPEPVLPIAPPLRAPVRPTVDPGSVPPPQSASAGCEAAGGDQTAGASTTPETARDPPPLSLRDVAPPAPVTRIAPQLDIALEAELRQLLGDSASGYGVVALDLRSGRSVSINGGQVFYAASLFKTWVMLQVFYHAELGLLRLGDELVLTHYYDAFGLGPRATVLCQRLSVQEALEAMMSVSDNAAAVLLQDLVGAPNINRSLEALGLTQSRLTTEDIPVTADDMALLMELIASGKAVSRGASEAMASLMTAETFSNGLASGIPAEALLAHKTGNWPNARHDAGIVFGPNTTYVLVILSDNRDGSLAMIAALSALVYESFQR